MNKNNDVIKVDFSEDTHYCFAPGLSQTPLFQGMGDKNFMGQFTYLVPESGGFRAARDPLGIGKLFYTETPSGELHFSPEMVQLFSHGSPVYSIPAGKEVLLKPGGVRKALRDFSPPGEGSEPWELGKFQKQVQERLTSLFRALRQWEDQGGSVYVALSGGLDSSIIATFAARYLQKPTACTLDLGQSEDSEKSQYIASHLGMAHLVFPTNEGAILEALEASPILCQDFRDFNVHCGALNILLAEGIQKHHQTRKGVNPDRVMVLTGDLMNEFTCDYAGEVIDGVEYYKLPRVGQKQLQQYLISGLDTSDREISVFGAYGLTCLQPFAALADLYQGVPEKILEGEDPKKYLNGSLVDPEILEFIPKVKLRAQVGSRENMGILGICHYKGISNKDFKKKLLSLNPTSTVEIPIFVGRYETESFG